MTNVLLTHSYHLAYDEKQAHRNRPYPPLATLYAAALLRKHGMNVAVFDTMLRDPSEFPQALAEHRPDIVAVFEDDYNYLSKMCLTRMREVAFQLLTDAKAFGAITVCHGPDETDHYAEYLQQGFDAVLLGESETTLLEICRSGLSPTMPGLATLTPRGELYNNRQRVSRDGLRHLPQAARDLIDMAAYRAVWKPHHGRFSTNVVASRGCPFRCNWCAKPIFGDRFQLRAPADVASEISSLRTEHGVEHIWFADDIFAIDRHWMSEFADLMSLVPNTPYKAQARADLMTDEVVHALARSGCEEVWMGVESGSQYVLNAMDKGLRPEQVCVARERLAQHGIRACYFLQFGYPGETWEDIVATVELVRATRPDDIGVSLSYPLPHTRFHDRVREQIGSKRNWRDSSDLCIIFTGTYTDAFYREIRDALHLEVESWSKPTDSTLKSAVADSWGRITRLEPASRNENPTFSPERHHSFPPERFVHLTGGQ